MDMVNPEWEYKTVEVDSEAAFGLSKTSEDPETELNRWGGNGWELTGQVNMENGATQLLILKRNPVPDQTCTQCGADNPSEASFCGECGGSLD